MSNKYDIRSIRPRIQFWNDFIAGRHIADSIIAVETNKDINEIAGSFNITLKPGSDMVGKFQTGDEWYDQFDPQDVVGITFDSAKNYDREKKADKGAQFLGLIDSVVKHNNYSAENPSRVTSISGRDFGSLLIDDSLIYAKEIFLAVNEDGSPISGEIAPIYTGAERDIVEKLIGRHPCFTPDCLAGFGSSLGTGSTTFTFAETPTIDAATFIIENASSIRNLVYKTGKDKKLVRDMLNIHDYVKRRQEYVCIGRMSLSAYQGNLLNFIRSVLDSDFNEIMIDTKDGKCYLRIRPKPFDKVGDYVGGKEEANKIKPDDEFCWENLESFYGGGKEPIAIEEHEVIECSLHRSKENVYSLFRATPALNEVDKVFGFVLNRATIDLYNLLRYGLNKLEANVSNIYDKDSGRAATDTVSECRDRLKNWNIYAPVYERGSLTIKGREDIHIGDKVLLIWHKRDFIHKETGYPNIKHTDHCKGFEFYVTGVKNRWVFGEAFTTTLKLDRGQSVRLLNLYKQEREDTLKYIAENAEDLYKEMLAFLSVEAKR
ncbi:MAG TPA: hypothetical protein DHW42_11785 [Candidatus Marinimicrobia bacterium]|nr:hypothetical protein [Candidatus Neomarinimicrobiota bacterium]